MSLRFAYNTNGLQSHRLEDALALLADDGYDGVALTLDVMHLDPLRAGAADVAQVQRLLRRLRLACVIETGARFVLDPRRKHHPPLDDPDPVARLRRLDHLRRCLELAAELGAEAMTLATGPAPGGQVDADVLHALRVEALRELVARGAELGVTVSLEPEPGHGVDTLAGWRALKEDVPELGLTLDVSHVSLTAPEGSVAEAIEAHAAQLTVVHLEDAPRGRHEHVPFGEGDLDLPGTLAALVGAGFHGLCAVELSRHSHRGHELPAASLAALRAALP